MSTSAPLGLADTGATTTAPIDESSPAEKTWTDGTWLDTEQLIAVIVVNVGSFLLACLLLRIVFPPKSPEELRRQKQYYEELAKVESNYQSLGKTERGELKSLNGSGARSTEVREMHEGDSAEETPYTEEWTKTFDLWFLIGMAAMLVILLVWTHIEAPILFANTAYWIEQLPKVAVMMTVSIIGGLLCRYFCRIDERGYIITNKDSVFKVNYTRKLQHFAAYLVPLLLHTRAAAAQRGALTLSWGNWFTLLGFLIMIKPLRERSRFVMLQFNALDRPEDRPETLSWIVGGNIVPGIVLIIFFRWLYAQTGLNPDLTYVFLFVTGIGDGFAEPVGIYLGRHKYWTKSCSGDRAYQRSFEGSACVWLSGLVFCSVMWYTFATSWQFWVTMLILPPVMTIAEAKSPHTIDTPFLMGTGGLVIFLVGHLQVYWASHVAATAG
jgi:dolichol kinase